MLFMFISAALAWIVAVAFMFRARKAVTAHDQAGLIMAIRLSRLLFVASIGCVLTAMNMKTGYSPAFFVVCGLAAIVSVKMILDLFQPERVAKKLSQSENLPGFKQ